MKYSILLLLWSMVSFQVFAAEESLIRGVVQVVGYENLYGQEPKMMGWGSASVIDDRGLLLTNNHVVDDGFGGHLDGFVICLTKQFNQRPDCHYTAALLERNSSSDIAVLRIDDTDIFGNPVDFSAFHPLPLSDNYTPIPQDSVLAVGYPWIGADTITQTVGIVAGTQQYNNVTYIKTDALIAGGNSGGPLLHDGQIIGVNTFGIGPEGTLSYALWIEEAKALIASSTNKQPLHGFDIHTFHNTLQAIDAINTQAIVRDSLFDFSLPPGYRVVEYVPGKKLSSQQSLTDSTSIQGFSFSRRTTPRIQDAESMSFYLQNQGLYAPSWQKMKQIRIGGYPAWDIFQKNDPSEGLANGWKQYIVQLNDREIVRIDLQAATYNEASFVEAKKKLDDFINSIQFKESIHPSLEEKRSIEEPKMTFLLGKNWGQPIGRENSSLGSLRYSAGIAQTYLGNMHQTLTTKVYPQTRDLGKGLSIQEVMQTLTEGMDAASKDIIQVQGYDGFILCSENQMQLQKKDGNTVTAGFCQVIIVIDDDKDLPYIVDVTLVAEMQQFSLMKKVVSFFLEHGIVFSGKKIGETTINNHLVDTTLPYTDLENQSREFKKTLKTIYTRGLLPHRSILGLNKPVTRGVVLEWRARFMFNVDIKTAKELCAADISYACVFSHIQLPSHDGSISLRSIAQALDIDLDAYASQHMYSDFSTVLQLFLAGVQFPYNGKNLNDFEELGEQRFPEERKKFEVWFATVYGKRKVVLHEIAQPGNYRAEEYILWNPLYGLKTIPAHNDTPIHFGNEYWSRRSDITQVSDTESICGKNPSFSCVYTQQIKESDSYQVMDFGSLLDLLLQEMDVSMFDERLVEKKEEAGYGSYGGF